jgi:hypothetical protein
MITCACCGATASLVQSGVPCCSRPRGFTVRCNENGEFLDCGWTEGKPLRFTDAPFYGKQLSSFPDAKDFQHFLNDWSDISGYSFRVVNGDGSMPLWEQEKLATELRRSN